MAHQFAATTTNLRRSGRSRSAPSPAHPLLGLQRAAGNRAVARLVAQRAPDGDNGAGTVALTVRWSLQAVPRGLQPVLEEQPASAQATVKAGGATATGDGEAVLQVKAGKRHAVTVAPTAAAPLDYYLPRSKKMKVGQGPATVEVALRFKRENDRFADFRIAGAGFDVEKASKIEKATLFGKTVYVNELVLPRVEAANGYFESDKLSDADRAAVKATLASVGSYNKRTTSKGGYSNHSTGCAIDINALSETTQNDHMLKSNKRHAAAMALFSKVLQTMPGWEGFDMWKVSDPQKILEASEQFNATFPGYLRGLLVDSGATQELPADATIMRAVSPAQLQAAIDRAKAAGRADTAAALAKVKGSWTSVRGWVEGVVTTKVGKKTSWMYAGDHAAQEAEGKAPTAVATNTGMVSLHPKLVESLVQSGWSWLVDYHSKAEKDYMHFEDRAASEALKA